MPVEAIKWNCHFVLRKYDVSAILDIVNQIDPLILGAWIEQNLVPYEERHTDNGLSIGGASALWQQLIGSGAITAFNNANAYIGVGGGAGATTAFADTQTDLQGASKTRKAQDATYPQHTDSTGTAGSKSIIYKSTFATGDANYAWDEWGLFNAAAAGRMLNRKVEALGTKVGTAIWTATATLSLA